MQSLQAETYYNGKLLYTDYYMTRSQWEKEFYKNAKINLKRNLLRKIRKATRKMLPIITTGIAVSTMLFIVSVLGYVANLL